jgi:hypothetical protein
VSDARGLPAHSQRVGGVRRVDRCNVTEYKRKCIQFVFAVQGRRAGLASLESPATSPRSVCACSCSPAVHTRPHPPTAAPARAARATLTASALQRAFRPRRSPTPLDAPSVRAPSGPPGLHWNGRLGTWARHPRRVGCGNGEVDGPAKEGTRDGSCAPTLRLAAWSSTAQGGHWRPLHGCWAGAVAVVGCCGPRSRCGQGTGRHSRLSGTVELTTCVRCAAFASVADSQDPSKVHLASTPSTPTPAAPPLYRSTPFCALSFAQSRIHQLHLTRRTRLRPRNSR